MTIKKRGKFWYGDEQSDIRTELARYSKLNEYPVDHFADAVCVCGGRVFRIRVDDNEGAAIRTCVACLNEHTIGDSADFLANAELEQSGCCCNAEEFEVTVGVSLYPESEDVRWLYLGCRCPKCGLTGCYGDWKNEFQGYRQLLKQI